MLSYCLSTVNASLESKRPETKGIDERLAASPSATGPIQRERGWREEEVLVSGLHRLRAAWCLDPARCVSASWLSSVLAVDVVTFRL